MLWLAQLPVQVIQRQPTLAIHDWGELIFYVSLITIAGIIIVHRRDET